MSSEIEAAIRYFEQELIEISKDVSFAEQFGIFGKEICEHCLAHTKVALQAMREKLEREQQPSGWIKMEDRKPDGDCIAFEANKHGVVFCYYSEWEASDWNVTHWHPLPEPPKEEIS